MKSCNVIFLFFLALFSFYFIMDILTYASLQTITLTAQNRNGSFSVFHPLSAKLLMTDQTNHYVLYLTAEGLEVLTGFSKRFYFITANMMTVAHLIVGLIAANYISSDNLYDRRKGVLMYEVKMWLDALDGAIYRSHNSDFVYKSTRGSFGYFMDVFSDVVGAVALCIGTILYLRKSRSTSRVELDSFLPHECKNTNEQAKKNLSYYNTKQIVWKVFCFGFQIAIASASWDKRVEDMENVFQTRLETSEQTALQTSVLHSFSTWCVMYLWRLFCGQSLLQIYLVAIFIDKIWEFLNLVQYLGYLILIVVNIITVLYIKHIKDVIGLN